MRSFASCSLLLLALATPASLRAQVGASQGMVDANTATEATLAGLPGMTADLVKAVLARRPFATMAELDAALAPLSAEQKKAFYAKAMVHLNLNTASRAEIMLIPGVGAKMAHEFEEYRPYTSLAQFRKEIGKYVDAAEVARLEQYVFVPIDLNTATDEQILTIPGLGRRMLREFKEYRPYKDMGQFRKEIGKYVNAQELARLERYVTIR